MGNITDRCCTTISISEQNKITQLALAAFKKPLQPHRKLRRSRINDLDSDYSFTDVCNGVIAQSIADKKLQPVRHAVDYLPRRNKLNSVTIQKTIKSQIVVVQDHVQECGAKTDSPCFRNVNSQEEFQRQDDQAEQMQKVEMNFTIETGDKEAAPAGTKY